MKHRTGLLATPALVVAAAAAALLAVPALAATTFTVSPGGAWSGTRAADSSVGIRDAVSNQVTLCSDLAVAGSFKSGRGLSGTGIGALTSIAFTGCKAEGVAVTVTVHTSAANPAPINLTQEFPVGSTVFTGRLLGDHLPGAEDQLTLTDAHPPGPPSAMRGRLGLWAFTVGPRCGRAEREPMRGREGGPPCRRHRS